MIGVGGGGGNAVNRMIDAQLRGIEFIAANTDLQALRKCRAPIKLQLGRSSPTRPRRRRRPRDRPQGGARGHRADPRAARGRRHDLPHRRPRRRHRHRRASPVIASLAAEIGALTVAVVTKPFAFEGRRRMHQAETRRRGAARGGRHADHHSQRAPAQLRRARHAAHRRVPDRRRRAAPGACRASPT